jgi:hypothetical protein
VRLLPASEHETAAAMLYVLALQDTGWPCKSSKEAKETRGDQGYWDSPDTPLDAICQHGLHQSSVRVHDGHRLQRWSHQQEARVHCSRLLEICILFPQLSALNNLLYTVRP